MNITAQQVDTQISAPTEFQAREVVPASSPDNSSLKNLGKEVLYQVYPRSCQDSNNDSIADYQDVDPQFGTLEDLDELIAQANARGIKVLADLVVNHSSDQHTWFQQALADQVGILMLCLTLAIGTLMWSTQMNGIQAPQKGR